ncbi:MAG: hypothetical protein ACP5N1_07190 [Candidatus Woesearchaeota archaeon]
MQTELKKNLETMMTNNFSNEDKSSVNSLTNYHINFTIIGEELVYLN